MTREIIVGDRVRLTTRPSYFKTADPMPMLRPPDLITVGQEGIVLDRRPGGFWVVRFANSAVLLDSQYLEIVALNTDKDNSSNG